jgi:hypothetical protein
LTKCWIFYVQRLEEKFFVTEFEGVNVIRAANFEPAASTRKIEPGFREISS